VLAIRVVAILVALAASARADGALVIHGGGHLSRDLIRTFVELGGGADGTLIVIPTAADDVSHADELAASWRAAGFGTVEVLHTRSRKRANADDLVAPLTTATAVWFDGGEQGRLADAYTGTRVETELHALLARGGVIGGSSAGAAIMSRVMIRSGKAKPRIGTGLALLPGAIIDQHFVARNREPRLLVALRKHPELVGLGIDEGTAIIVRDGAADVVGESSVTVALAATADEPAKTTVLAAGDRLDLAAVADEAAERNKR
jgi:cyanophycinase